MKDVLCLAVLAGGRLASASGDGMIKIWDLATRACVATLQGHERLVSSLAVLASGSNGQTIKIWNLATGECVATLEGHGNRVCSLAVLAGGRLASGSRDQKIKIWNVATSACGRRSTGIRRRDFLGCWRAVGWRAELMIRKLRFGIRH